MRRPTALEVDTVASNDLVYELDTTPPSSLYTVSDLKDSTQSIHEQPQEPSLPPPEPSLSPSICLLFSLLTLRQRCILVTPAVLFSICAGGIAPFMTFVIGQVFDAFAHFPSGPDPSTEAKHKLLHDVGISAAELVGLAVGSLALSSTTSSLWIWTGELNVRALRKRVYQSVTRKDMTWFDTKMGAEGAVQSADQETGPVGAGGLMAKFTRETDDVRMATSLASGMLVQYLTTSIAALVLAFTRSWQLTLVILSAVPALMLIQGFSQAIAGPLLARERGQSARAGTLIDRAVAAITTVKTFNAADHEYTTLDSTLSRMAAADKKLNGVWGTTSGLSQFVMMAMFVQGFWFGAKLVRDGKAQAGDVMAVFWACLIFTSNMQMCVPQFITITKGKFAMVSLLSLVDAAPPPPPSPASPSTPSFSRHSRQSRSANLRKITPSRCTGELSLHDVTFAYPSRPTMPVLQDVSLYLPANEMTFIVGGSGSGKSTIAQLLLRLYTPQSGSIQLDDQDLMFLDEDYTRENVAAVSQGCILFDMSVHDNVAMGLAGIGNGRTPEDATREEVVDACVAALMHDFIRDLPDGYETRLGTGGANLSGGQKQRLAIARAKLRNPSVLILDEATSALDPTSRILVFEAIKRWRVNKTTIVITHDLSQISSSDFVYVLKTGHVVEQGYRYDLETSDGEFRHMMETQGATGGYLPTKNIDEQTGTDDVEAILEEDIKQELDTSILASFGGARESMRPLSIARPVTFGNWMFEVVADLTAKNTAPSTGLVSVRETMRLSRYTPTQEPITEMAEYEPRSRRPSSVVITAAPRPPSTAHTVQSRRYSLQFTPTSPVFSFHASPSMATIDGQFDDAFDKEKVALERSATKANSRRRRQQSRTHWDDAALSASVKVDKIEADSTPPAPTNASQTLPFWKLMGEIYPTIPYKPFILLGLITCILSGAMTPVFSYLLSRLLFEVSTGAENIDMINLFGAIVLGIAALDGLLLGAKYFIMETGGMLWIMRIRRSCFKLVLQQDKKWFDKTENSPVRLVQILVKDGDDARNLIAVVIGQCLVVGTMLSVGLIWALVRGWQLTLVGFAIAPVFAMTMAIQSRLIAKCEVRNKRAREDVAKAYYEAISNIRGIRSMALEGVFQSQFNEAAERALSTGVLGAFVEGCTYGVASGLIYLAEALLFFVGAVLISRGYYTYLQMVEVLNLVVFTVTIGSQLMAFTEKIAKSLQATRDFNELLRLDTNTDESRGILKPTMEGDVIFHNVEFSYPERADVPVLKNLNLQISEGECVAIVGTSGSGKSTIAALLQRFYEPSRGTISVGLNELRATDVKHLRHHVSVVSQNPHLFDATISENITYGDKSISELDVRKAAKAANAHEFIMTLPQGYDTLVGENASLVSGGQAQRLQIARALARPSKIMILDECTSALDSTNQAAVLDAIHGAKDGRTVIMVTHKIAVMQQCDRILVVHDGQIAEHGSYQQLIDRKGLFASLASGGEWAGE